MSQVLHIIDKINKFILITVGIILGIMSVVIIYQVFSRFFLGLPLPWSEELARYLMAYTIFAGAALALRQQKMIAVEFISERLTWKTRRILKTIVNIICIIFFILLFFKGFEMMERVHLQVSGAMRIPMSIPYASIPVGSTLLTMNAIAVIIEMYTKEPEEIHAEKGDII